MTVPALEKTPASGIQLLVFLAGPEENRYGPIFTR
jgi:hypothetical protein